MVLSSGGRLGNYEILSPIGAGGMGEVYRARDTKLGREVAIKVLPEELSRDQKRLARFEREAKLLAQLNHPNIATLHGLEDANDQEFLVMELVEGETLAERIARGPIPMNEAMRLFIQIAEGLEAAHERGIIHRDLKPANIKIGPDEKVKVLDFGLAKAYVGEEASAVDSSQSPTLTKGTALGAIMGTASYMSPEQARGKSVDKRSDIWAFGCCLFEALSGRKAFDGETATDVLGAIVHKEPNWDLLPKATPWQIDRLLRRCFQKSVKERTRDIGDAKAEIRDAMQTPPSALAVGARGHRVSLTTATAIGLLAAALAGVAVWSAVGSTPSETRDVTRFAVELSPADSGDVLRIGNPLAISPDGRKLVIATESQLYLRSLDQIGATPIPGTEGGIAPFFSPDGKNVGFFTEDSLLKKVSLDGGDPTTVVSGAVVSSSASGGSWGTGGTIVFSRGNTLQRVSADGGEPEAVFTGENLHQGPVFLPDNERVLFTRVTASDARPVVVNLRTGAMKEVATPSSRFAFSSHYLPSGYLLYAEPTGLMAARFDPDSLELLGPAVRVLEGVYFSWGGSVGYAVSDTGTLAYFLLQGASTLLKVDRRGVETTLAEAPQEYYTPRLSPDGDRLAVSVYDATIPRRDIWTYDLVRGSMTRMTFSDKDSTDPVWSPDGKQLAFASNRAEGGNWRIFVKSADGTGDAIRLDTSLPGAMPNLWLMDGESVLFKTIDPGFGGWNIGRQALDDAGEPATLLGGTFNEFEPSLSPDGRWLAYVSDESGQRQVYVRRFPSMQNRSQVSTDGGDEPRFSPAGGEIFYRNGDRMMVVSYKAESEISFSKPEMLFEGHYNRDPFNFDAHNYDVTADGQSFIMVRSAEASSEIHVVVNWAEDLKRLVPDEN